ncbi:MAG TPA: Holliday junction branch migration protein RuvA [Candidatus Saccharimonadales bacterium]|nr:Holliday junction branch migration protein RuvA [Candidatus Saccharimonadales bacterium]
MIGSLFGTITSIQENKIIVQQSGIGFELFCPEAKNFTLKQEVALHTYMHWSQENGPSLFGFSQPLQKDVFLLIISCSGIGPKLGLSILEQVNPSIFLQMVSEENMSGLNGIKGLGAKKAEQLCMHLREKAPKLIKVHPHLATQTSLSVWGDLQDTLASLHYSPIEIKQTISILKEAITETTPTFDVLLRKALTILSK